MLLHFYNRNSWRSVLCAPNVVRLIVCICASFGVCIFNFVAVSLFFSCSLLVRSFVPLLPSLLCSFSPFLSHSAPALKHLLMHFYLDLSTASILQLSLSLFLLFIRIWGYVGIFINSKRNTVKAKKRIFLASVYFGALLQCNRSGGTESERVFQRNGGLCNIIMIPYVSC